MKQIVMIFIILFMFFSLPKRIYAAPGCCSWHGGQSYCDGSNWVCNDGWESSCSCIKSDYFVDEETNHYSYFLIMVIFLFIFFFSILFIIFMPDWEDKK